MQINGYKLNKKDQKRINYHLINFILNLKRNKLATVNREEKT